MSKTSHKLIRIAALILCVLMVLPFMVACEPELDTTNKGSYITMYLSDEVIDLDPAHCYINDASIAICSLLYQTLFKLDENGKVVKGLVDSYSIEESNRYGECVLTLNLRAVQWTSNNAMVRADDVVYAWKRILKSGNSNEAAALLFDIKNARAAKAGDCSIDDVGIYAVEDYVLQIQFEEPIDFDRFFLNLTSVALAPVLETSVKQGEDWAKKSSTMACNGPFKLSKTSVVNVESILANAETTIRNSTNDLTKAKSELAKAKAANDSAAIATQEAAIAKAEKDIAAAKANQEKYKDVTYESYVDASQEDKSFTQTYVNYMVLERNPYYLRDNGTESKDALDKAVTPYRIVIQCGLSNEELAEKYDNGDLYCLYDIPLSLRETYKDDAKVTDAMSTFSFFPNENALIKSSKNPEGEAIFAIKEVRTALSLALDRQAIADTVVFAEPAEGIVPNGVFDSVSSKKTFRSAIGKQLSANADMAAAKAMLSAAGITASNYTFSITVCAYDEVNVAIAEMAQKAWKELGFNVELKRLGFITNNDYNKATDSTPNDVIDDLFAEAYRAGDFEIIGVDLSAISADAFSVLAPFATEFSGMALDMTDVENAVFGTHITGYSSEAYDELIEAAFAADGKNAERTDYLHQAEKLLIEDMAVIPVVANQHAIVISKSLKGVAVESYYAPFTFAKAQIKNWYDHVASYSDLLK